METGRDNNELSRIGAGNRYYQSQLIAISNWIKLVNNEYWKAEKLQGYAGCQTYCFYSI